MVNRQHLTSSSRVMLVAYPVFSLGIGLALTFGNPVRTISPSYNAAREVMPISKWGVYFIALGLLYLIAWVVHHRTPMILALCLGAALSLMWAFWFTASIFIDGGEKASLTAPQIWAFVMVAHIASLNSLTKDSVGWE